MTSSDWAAVEHPHPTTGCSPRLCLTLRRVDHRPYRLRGRGNRRVDLRAIVGRGLSVIGGGVESAKPAHQRAAAPFARHGRAYEGPGSLNRHTAIRERGLYLFSDVLRWRHLRNH